MWSLDGRIGRGDFWVRSIMIGGLSVGAGFIIGLLSNTNTIATGDARDLTTILSILLNIAFGWFLLATHVKRWHDLNYSGWISLINFLPQTVYLLTISLPSDLLYEHGLDRSARDAIGIAAIAMSLFVLIFLGFCRGTKGPNSFGDDPI
jgi:uncharacterized membrane protein YhaH (DUF805 family)